MLRKLIYEAGARMRNPSLMEQFEFFEEKRPLGKGPTGLLSVGENEKFSGVCLSLFSLFIGRCSKRLDSFHRK